MRCLRTMVVLSSLGYIEVWAGFLSFIWSWWSPASPQNQVWRYKKQAKRHSRGSPGWIIPSLFAGSATSVLHRRRCLHALQGEYCLGKRGSGVNWCDNIILDCREKKRRHVRSNSKMSVEFSRDYDSWNTASLVWMIFIWNVTWVWILTRW